MTIQKHEGSKLSLQNDGRLSIFFVGVGSAFSKRHYQTNIIIIKGADHIMIDCGSKAPQALWELGLSVMDVKNFLITHSHADHIGGLEEVMLMYRYVARKKPTIVINKIFQHILWDLSLRGGSSFNEEHEGSMLSFHDMWDVLIPNWLPGYPRETMEANVGGINLKIFRTKHIPDFPNSWQNSFWSCGLIIDDRVMFTSDTRFDDDLIGTFSSRFNLETIFHDVQFFTGGVHAGLDEVNTLPKDLKNRMVLMHYGDNWEDNAAKVASCGFRGLAKQWHHYLF